MAINGKEPTLGKDVFVAPSASVIGNVHIGSKSTVWYHGILKGDIDKIEIGELTSIGDAASILGKTQIGNQVLIGEGSVLHSCIVQDEVQIEVGSVINNDVTLKKHAIIQAGSVVSSGATVPEGQMWGGTPAKFIRELTDEEKVKIKELSILFYEKAQLHSEAHEKDAYARYLDSLDDAAFLQKTLPAYF